MVYLFATQLFVAVGVNLLEDVGGWRRSTDVDKLHLEDQSGFGRNHVASTAIAVAQLGRNH